MTVKKTPTKQNKKEAKAQEKAKNKKAAKEKSVSKGKYLKFELRLSKDVFFTIHCLLRLNRADEWSTSLKAMTRYLTQPCVI